MRHTFHMPSGRLARTRRLIGEGVGWTEVIMRSDSTGTLAARRRKEGTGANRHYYLGDTETGHLDELGLAGQVLRRADNDWINS